MNQGHPQYAAYAQPGPYDQPAYYAEQPVHRAPQQHMQYYAEQYVEQPMQYAPQQSVPSPYQSDFAPPLLPPMMPPAMPQYPMSAGYAQQSYAQQSYDQVSYQQQVPVPVPQYQPIPSHQPQLMSQQMLQQQPMQPPQPIQPQQSQKSYTPPLSNGGKGKLVKPGRYWPGKWLKLVELEKPVYESDLAWNKNNNQQQSERTGPECGPPLAGTQPPPKMAPPPPAVPPPQMAPPPQVAPPPPNKYFEEGSSGEAL